MQGTIFRHPMQAEILIFFSSVDYQPAATILSHGYLSLSRDSESLAAPLKPLDRYLRERGLYLFSRGWIIKQIIHFFSIIYVVKIRKLGPEELL